MRVLDAGALIALDRGSRVAAHGGSPGRSGTNDVLDALVALAAQDRPGHEVLTSDPVDIHHLLQALNIRRTIRVV